MPLDSIAVSCLRKELIPLLSGGKVEKIYQPERDEISVIIKTRLDRYKLLISADSSNPRAYITENTKQNPLSAPLFCMLLRKHLSGATLEDISVPPYERIITFTFSAYNELGDRVKRNITAELMGRHSNIILTEQDNRIIDCARHVDLTVSSVRCVLPGLFYEPAPAGDRINPQNATYEDIFSALMSASGEVRGEKALLRLFSGLSPLAAREVIFRATGDTDSALETTNVKAIADSLYKFISQIENGEFSPCLLLDSDGRPRDFAAYNITCYGDLYKVIPFDSISRVMDEFYFRRDKIERMRQKSAALRKTVSNMLDRKQHKLSLLQETLAGAANKETYRIYGELLTANLYRGDVSGSSITVENFYNDNQPVTIELDSAKTLSQNAQIYFTRYRKAKTAEKTATTQIKLNIEEIEYLESVLTSIDNAEEITELSEIRSELVSSGYITDKQAKKIKSAPLSAPLRYEIDGFEVYAGKNNRQNEQVTFKIGRAEDIWLHAKDMPGSHTVIKTNRGEPVPDKVIEKAASIAAFYSKGKNMPLVPIDYTEVKNVKKIPGAKTGMVIYDKFKTAHVTPAEPK